MGSKMSKLFMGRRQSARCPPCVLKCELLSLHVLMFGRSPSDTPLSRKYAPGPGFSFASSENLRSFAPSMAHTLFFARCPLVDIKGATLLEFGSLPVLADGCGCSIKTRATLLVLKLIMGGVFLCRTGPLCLLRTFGSLADRVGTVSLNLVARTNVGLWLRQA